MKVSYRGEIELGEFCERANGGTVFTSSSGANQRLHGVCLASLQGGGVFFVDCDGS